MPVKEGQYLGRIRSVEELRQRCFVDESTGCWHYRGRCDSVFVQLADGTKVSRRLRRVAYIVANGFKNLSGKYKVYATANCHSEDCANPAHARRGDQAAALRQAGERGAYSAPERVALLLKSSQSRKKRTPEMELAIANDTGRLRDIAERHGVSITLVKIARNGGPRKQPSRVASVFTFRP